MNTISRLLRTIITIEYTAEPSLLCKNMAAIHSKNTKLEMIVRRGLWKRGFRYRQTKKNCCCAQFAGFVQQEGK